MNKHRFRLMLGKVRAIPKGEFWWGLLAFNMGLCVMFLPWTDGSADASIRRMFCLGAMPFMIHGLFLMQIYRLWGGATDRWTELYFGSWVLLAGTILVLVALFTDATDPTEAEPNPPPPLILVGAGVLFFLAGAFLLSGRKLQVSSGVFPQFWGLVMVTIFAALTVWVASLDCVFIPGAIILSGLALWGWGTLVRDRLRR